MAALSSFSSSVVRLPLVFSAIISSESMTLDAALRFRFFSPVAG